MEYYQPSDLYQLQTQLVDAKVDIAVNKAIDRIIDQISVLRTEMHELKHDMNMRFGAIESRLAVVESKLGIKEETQRKIQHQFIDYIFKAGWLVLAAIFLYFHFHIS